eukprot:6074337-Amphidinium_carterae.1
MELQRKDVRPPSLSSTQSIPRPRPQVLHWDNAGNEPSIEKQQRQKRYKDEFSRNKDLWTQ